MKKTIVGLMVGVAMFGLVGCSGGEQSSTEKEKQGQEQLQKESLRQVGMPKITHFFEKKMAKEIMELRDNPDLATYTYTKNQMTGKYVFEGRSIGYGLPYSTQLTNPEQIDYDYNGGNTTIAQADPNALYSSGSTSASWVMLVNTETNERNVAYFEQEVSVRQVKIPAQMCESWSLPSNY